MDGYGGRPSPMRQAGMAVEHGWSVVLNTSWIVVENVAHIPGKSRHSVPSWTHHLLQYPPAHLYGSFTSVAHRLAKLRE